jgi:hypothetical protein
MYGHESRTREEDMATYLLIESRDPWECRDTGYFYQLSGDLAAAGDDVTLFLIQNGVLADEFSLRERGIRRHSVAASVEVSDVDALVDLLMDGQTKAIWH